MLQPLGARALIKRIDPPKVESQHIIIPDTISPDGDTNFAMIVALGKKALPWDFSVGDLVILSAYRGSPVMVILPGDERESECSIVNEEDVLAVVEGV